MSPSIPWLPPLVLQEDYDGYKEFFDAVYGYFVDDFIKSVPSFNRRKVKSKRHVAYDGKDHSFWHCIEESCEGEVQSEENRVPKLSLCERIRWPRPVIENAISDTGVLAWKETRRGRGTKERVHILLEDEGYVVVLDPRGKDEETGEPKYYFLWTTFICDSPRRLEQMRRRCQKSGKMY